MKPTHLLAVLACLAFLPLAPAARAADPISADDVARLRVATQVAISPDGKHVAYVRSVPRKPWDEANGPAWAELHVVDRAGNSRPFVTGEVNVSAVEWTRDGKQIAFLAKRGADKNAALWTIALDGGEARKAVSFDTAITGYALRPDGKEVAFLATEKPDEKKKTRADKGFDAEIYEEQPEYVRVWIGQPFAETGAPRKLELQGSASELRYSPDGQALAVALAPTPSVDDNYMARRVHVVDVATGAVRSRIDNIGKLGAVQWSPDGQRLALISGADLNDPHEGCLMTASAGGGAVTNVLPDIPAHVLAFAWLDAARFLCLIDQGTSTSLEIVSADGKIRDALIPPGGNPMGGLDLAESGGACAFLAESARFPNEVFAADLASRTVQKLTDGNPWLAERRFAEQESIRYLARDGLDVEAILVHPLDEAAGTLYPLIVAVHGGPEAHLRNGWITSYSNPGQVAAAKGFAVLYPNYRGSTGRGVKYSKLDQGDMGGKEFDDLVDGVDHLVKAGLVDSKKVGVTGGSYGGYATAWCSTKLTERFAAGVMMVGISDHISKWGTSDIPNEMYLVHELKYPWQDWDIYEQRSPIRFAEQAKTPLLILHGKDDPRVHPSQSLELYRYLKTLGKVPVRLVWYPGEGHGNRKAAARYDFNVRMMQWFEHYLKGAGGPMPAPDLELPFEQPAENK